MIEVQSTSTSGTVTTFLFNDHPQRRINFFGEFDVKLPIITTSTNTVEFGTIGVLGSSIPLYLYNGAQATVADLVTTTGGIIKCFYDRTNNRLQALGVAPATT